MRSRSPKTARRLECRLDGRQLVTRGSERDEGLGRTRLPQDPEELGPAAWARPLRCPSPVLHLNLRHFVHLALRLLFHAECFGHGSSIVSTKIDGRQPNRWNPRIKKTHSGSGGRGGRDTAMARGCDAGGKGRRDPRPSDRRDPRTESPAARGPFIFDDAEGRTAHARRNAESGQNPSRDRARPNLLNSSRES